MARCFLAALAALFLMEDPAGAAEPPGSPDVAKAQRTLAELCAHTACRTTPWRFTLRLSDGGTLESPVQPYPYLDDHGQLYIFPGETIGLAVQSDSSGIGYPELAEVSNPAGPVTLNTSRKATLTFSFFQMEGKPDMMLRVVNTTNATLRYDATLYLPAGNGVRSVRTSTCPVPQPQPGAPAFSGFEQWPQPILMLIVTNIRAVEKTASMACQ